MRNRDHYPHTTCFPVAPTWNEANQPSFSGLIDTRRIAAACQSNGYRSVHMPGLYDGTGATSCYNNMNRIGLNTRCSTLSGLPAASEVSLKYWELRSSPKGFGNTIPRISNSLFSDTHHAVRNRSSPEQTQLGIWTSPHRTTFVPMGPNPRVA